MKLFGFNIGKKKTESKSSVIDQLGLLNFFSWSGASWSDKVYRAFAQETYLKNVIAFRCIDIKAKAIQTIPWELYERTSKGRTLVNQESTVSKFLRRPNQKESWGTMMYKISAYFDIGGNVYVYKIAPESGPNKNIPLEITTLMPDKVSAKTERGRLIGYNYRTQYEEKFFEVDPITQKSELLHIRLFNPLDEINGASSTMATQKEIDISNKATEWNKKMIDNEARPGLIVTSEGSLSQTQRDYIRQQINDGFSGPSGAGQTMVFDGSGKMTVSPYTWSPKDMDWIESNKESARKICFGYGVPPQLVGIPDNMTFSNYKEAREAFWEDTVIPMADFFGNNLNHYFFDGEDKLFIAPNYDGISALSEKRARIWKMANDSDFLKINEKREMTGFEAVKGGDVIMVPINMVPLGTDVNADTGDSEAEENSKKALIESGMSEEEALEVLGLPKID